MKNLLFIGAPFGVVSGSSARAAKVLPSLAEIVLEETD